LERPKNFEADKKFDKSDISNPSMVIEPVSVRLKNVERILKKRGRENVLFIDNNLYSYIN
jgi:hypothetical protein